MTQVTFITPYDQHADRQGQLCEIVGPVPKSEYDFEEVGPMYRVRFQDDAIIDAWPEEIGMDDTALQSVGIKPERYRTTA